MRRCVVIGAGISGLSLAHELTRRGIDVRVYEAAPRAGGKIASERQGAYLVEHGPAGFFGGVPAVEALVRELGLDARRLWAGPAARRRGVVIGGAFVEVPTAPLALARSPLLSWRGKLRLLADLVLPCGRAADESIAAFSRRRLGVEATERLVYPLISGLYAGDAETISLGAAFPPLRALEREHRSLILGALRTRPRAAAELSSFRDGMAELTAALASGLGERLRTGAPVTAIARRRGRFQLTVEEADTRAPVEADAVVLAVPAHAAAPLVAPLDFPAARAAGMIPYVPVVLVNLAYGAEPARGAYGFLVGPRERSPLLGAVFVSDVYAHRAPAGELWISARIGGARAPALAERSDADLVALANGELRRVLGLRGPLGYTRVIRHAQALPQYTLGHADRLGVLDAAERRLPGLYFTGNAYRGLGVRECIGHAAPLAERIAAELAQPRKRRA